MSFFQGKSRLKFVTEYLLQSDLSEENWTHLPFKNDMLIYVKNAFSQEDRVRGKAVVKHSYGIMCSIN